MRKLNQQLRISAPARNSLQKGYRMKKILKRGPKLPQTYQTVAGRDGKCRRNAMSLALAQNNQMQATGNQTQAIGKLTIVDICSQLDNQTQQLLAAGTKRNIQNGVAPTNQNATVLPSTNEIKQQLDTNMLPAFT
ncbi:pentatricopeptide repeat-containing protein mitochondrial-like [Dorcoceras hygrometricum]|uniref:Pentatricopeptide repeat-containing protein mitochondrial-like n=1 Tax=Dorcoceras hygrometricum TaxID=472368 RepID=A0A2Z7B2B0_9LAMI|nr:pentatricopeptide repeat-containing protein mitochondrial-like [Dorcoceras hygrometricum]